MGNKYPKKRKLQLIELTERRIWSLCREDSRGRNKERICTKKLQKKRK